MCLIPQRHKLAHYVSYNLKRLVYVSNICKDCPDPARASVSDIIVVDNREEHAEPREV